MASAHAELGGGRRSDVRKARDGQRERAQPRPRIQADEDEGTDARRQQAGDQHELHHGPAQPGGLHQQEGPGQGGAEQGGDGGEAARRRHHGLGAGRGVPLGQPDGDHPEPPAESDQRGLGAEDHAQAQGREGGEHDAGKVDGAGWPAAHLEPVGGGVAAGPGQVPEGEGDQYPRHRQRQQGPPQRLGVEAQALGQVGEDPALHLADQREEEVSHRRDGRPDDRGQHQQGDIAPGPQQRQRVGWRRHRISSSTA